MATRDSLRRPLQKLPTWVLVLLAFFIAIPMHITLGAFEGLKDGWSEVLLAWNLD